MRIRIGLGIRSYRILLAAVVLSAGVGAQPWQPLGPDGGSVRSLAFDPNDPDRIFLGTSAGVVYLSRDHGQNWSRLARLGSPEEMVLDHIVVDPSNAEHLYAAAWNAQAPNSDGDLYRSKDGGKSWERSPEMRGKSIRALAMAASDPKILVAGVLDGVFRSRDGGESWERISPANHAEIKNVESVAIDPANPEIVYAGTWHLAWKTEDAGKTWRSIKKGVIDDSDVFSIVIDSENPANLYISACSGIYRSESAGELFRKIQGIPYSARRTRALRMDSTDKKIVYAGTTEGLWKTTDAGLTWKRMTRANVIINEVLIDPRHPARVMLATDRGGVLLSNDGGVTFSPSNRGFTHRQVAALLVDHADGASFFAGVLSDKEFGGVFVSRDRGRNWNQISDGLDGRDVFVLRQAADRSLVAGTDHGIFQLKADNSRWQPLNVITQGDGTVVKELTAHISALEVSGAAWYAVTSAGFLISSDQGHTWQRAEVPGVPAVLSVAAVDRMVVVAGHDSAAVSVNSAESWLPLKFPDEDLYVNSVAVDANGDIWLAGREGVYRSTNAGDTWKRIYSLRLPNVVSIQFDEENQRILATGVSSTSVMESLDHGRTWSLINSGWPLRNVRSAHGRLLGTTPFDGVVIQPDTSAAMR
jgi:photosystem II stability/assembly factor-like uncharacterized protein